MSIRFDEDPADQRSAIQQAGSLRYTFAVALLLLVVCTGCNFKKTVTTSGSATVDGCEIKYSVDDNAKFTSSPERVTLAFGRHQLLLEKSRLFFDGKERVMIAPNVKKIDVNVAEGKIKVTANAATVFNMTLPQ